jgi:hypothetical protein
MERKLCGRIRRSGRRHCSAGRSWGIPRRTKRLVDVAARQAAEPKASTHKVCGGSAAIKEGTFRFLRNKLVNPDAIAESGFAVTVEICMQRKNIIVAEDSTTMNYFHSVADELGDVGGVKGRPTKGYCIHSARAVDFNTKEVLGLLDHHRWIRPDNRPNAKERKKRKYEEKETIKWQRSSERVRDRMPSTDSLCWVCDREADIHEYVQDKVDHGEQFVVRALQDRVVAATEDEPECRLWARMETQAILGERKIAIEQRGCKRGIDPRPSRPAREVVLEVRSASVTLAPKDPHHRERRPIELNVVFLIEKNPVNPDDVLQWMLLTSLPVATFEEAVKVIECYEARWIVEEFHKAWKTGCQAEQRRFQSAANLERLLVILAFIGVRILQLRTAMLAESHQSCEAILPRVYWQCLYAAVNPKKPLPKRVQPVPSRRPW